MMQILKKNVPKWAIYALLAIVCFCAQEYVFAYLKIAGVSPILLGSLAVCVGMFEGGAAGAIFGGACGLMLYAAGGSSELLYAAIYAVGAAAVGSLCEHLMNRRLASALLAALCVNAAATLLYFTVVMLLPGRAGLDAFVTIGLLEIVYSAATALISYPAVRLIAKSFAESDEED